MATSRVIGVYVALAVLASGCGSSRKASPSSTVASTPSISTATSTPTQSTGTTTTQKPGLPPQNKHAKAARERQVKAAEKYAKTLFKAKAKPIAPTRTHLPRSRRYPEAVKERFLAACQVGKGSPSRCKCVLAKQELRPVEKGQSITELLILEAAIEKGVTLDQATRHAVPLPRGLRRTLATCRGA